MEPWNTNGDHHFVTTREATHRSDETLRSTSDLLALRAERTLLHRLPQPTDRQDVRAHSRTQHHDGPRAHDRPAHRHAHKSGDGRALGRPALPLQPGARPNGAPPAPPHPTQTPASTPPNYVLTPQLTEKQPAFLDTVGHNQTDSTDYTHTIC